MWLLYAGADRSIRDKYGDLAEDLAEKYSPGVSDALFATDGEIRLQCHFSDRRLRIKFRNPRPWNRRSRWEI